MRQSGRNKRLGHRTGAPVARKIPDTVILHDRSHKVPGRGEGVNDSGNSAISGPKDGDDRRAARSASRVRSIQEISAKSGASGIFARDWVESRTKRRFFPVYQRLPRTL